MEEHVDPLPGPRAVIGEGPSFDAARDTLWWFDIPSGRLFEHRFADRQTVMHELPFMASALARIDDERQLLCTENGFFIRTIATGELQQHQPLEADDTSTRSNDARTHVSGAFWVSTMHKAAEAECGSIYWYRKGEVRKLFDRLTVPNSICFSPDGERAYFSDTRKSTVYTVALDAETGLPQGEPGIFIEDIQGPDGAVVDSLGNIYIARWGGSRISVFSADGIQVQDIPVPTAQPTCPVFIGHDFGRLATTTASVNRNDETAGSTFVLPGRVKGISDPAVVL
ncbi:SMP-30/gluconolactonase/LRE family protein [Aureimonas fodinaquatilis]|uniref:SMP-30/gluconolactonase/LRE family protein n=1 Tax=Aureimonas fodinaquatilis TaxID=2565783 RepID=UPI00165D867B|nr:SMP-30/gluconolactonase/LRE family protein [Aureimonas fodinaquatilis]